MKRVFAIITAVMVLVACGGGESQDPMAFAKAQKKQELINKIRTLENEVNSNASELDRAKASELVGLYQDFYNQNADDTTAAAFLFNGASMATAIGKHQQAIRMLEAYHDVYKTAPKRPDALYLIGFVYDNGLKNSEKAKQYYQRTIDLYPGTFWAEQATSAMALSGMSEEELLKFLEEKNKSN